MFVDGSGTRLNMSRDYVRSVRGQRAYSRGPYHPGERTLVGLSAPGKRELGFYPIDFSSDLLEPTDDEVLRAFA